MPTVRILTAALLLAALLPASASAQDATIAKPALESIYTGVDGVDDISVTLNNPPAIIFQRSSGAMLSAGSTAPTCSPAARRSARGSRARRAG